MNSCPSHDARRLFLLMATLAAVATLWLAAPGAEAKSAKISNLDISLEVRSDGSIEVSEESTWKFSGGDFSRVSRELLLLSGQELLSLSVYERSGGSLIPYSPGQMGVRTPGTYAVSGGGQAYQIEIYYSAGSGETRTFVISYEVAGVAVVYQDVADVQWTWIGKANTAAVDRLTVNARIPASAIPLDDFRVWGHGPLSGEVRKLSNSEAVWEVKKIPPNTLVDGRMVFPASLISARNVIPRQGLPQILEEEQRQAEAANRERLEQRLKAVGAVAFGLVSAGIWLLLFLRFGREYRPSVSPPYERDIPSALPPAVVGYLWNFGSVTPKEVTATLMDLVRRGFMRIQPAGSFDPGIFAAERPDYAYVWTGTPKKSGDSMRPFEEMVAGFVLGAVNPALGLPTQSALESFTRSHPSNVRSFFTNFQRAVREAGEMEGFIERRSLAISVVAGVLAAGTAGVALVLFGVPWGLFPFAVGLLEFFGTATMKRRSRRGRDEYERWKAFARFLQDFSIMGERLPTELPLWERYLVYAIPLGVAEKVIEQMRFLLPPEQSDQLLRGYGYTPARGGYSGAAGYSLVSGFTGAFSAAVSRASSGSGRGGGFSGGGGGGGGGGGYSAD